jgi:hypothetical protein
MLHDQYDTNDDHHNEQQLLHGHPLLPRAINKKLSLQKAHVVTVHCIMQIIYMAWIQH